MSCIFQWVNKERVYSKMITALNVYTDGNDFLSKCVRTADFYSTGTDLNVLRDPIMGLRSNDAAARAISTISTTLPVSISTITMLSLCTSLS